MVSRGHLPMIVFPRMRNRNGWNVVDAFERPWVGWFIDEEKEFSWYFYEDDICHPTILIVCHSIDFNGESIEMMIFILTSRDDVAKLFWLIIYSDNRAIAWCIDMLRKFCGKMGGKIKNCGKLRSSLIEKRDKIKNKIMSIRWENLWWKKSLRWIEYKIMTESETN